MKNEILAYNSTWVNHSGYSYAHNMGSNLAASIYGGSLMISLDKIPDKLNDLSNDELNALAAKWCEGKEVRWWGREYRILIAGSDLLFKIVPSYTTNGDDAMRLQEKYKLWINYRKATKEWTAFTNVFKPHSNKNLLRAIAEAALAAALMEENMNTIECDRCKQKITGAYYEYAEYFVSSARNVLKGKRHLCLVCEPEFHKWLEN